MIVIYAVWLEALASRSMPRQLSVPSWAAAWAGGSGFRGREIRFVIPNARPFD